MSNIHAKVTGTFVSAEEGRIQLSQVGEGAPNLVKDVNDCPVTLNGEDVTLADLKQGDRVTLTGDPIVTVDATRKEK